MFMPSMATMHPCAALLLLALAPVAAAEYTLVDDMQVPTARAGRGAGELNANFLMVGPGSRKLWSGGRVNYYVNTKFSNPLNPTNSVLKSDDARIQWAVRHWEEVTCVRFFQCATEEECPKPYIRFQTDNGGCNSPVGVDFDGINEINLSGGCDAGTVAHEIGHTMGMEHEQARNDRDDHIFIDFSQIQPSFKMAFHRNGRAGRDIGPYDYASLMHYRPTAFRIGSKPTIIAPEGKDIGRKSRLSAGDIQAIHFMYNTCRDTYEVPICIASRHEDRVLTVAVGEAFDVEFNVNYDKRVVVSHTGTAPRSRMWFSAAEEAVIPDGVGKVNVRFQPDVLETGRTYTVAVTFAGETGDCVSSVTVKVLGDRYAVDGSYWNLRADAGATITAPSGTITDGFNNYPNEYDASLSVVGEDCSIDFGFFDVESSDGCVYDYVTIAYGGTTKKVCGKGTPTLVTGADGFSVTLRSDEAVTAQGFRLNYACGAAKATLPPATPVVPPFTPAPAPADGGEYSVRYNNNERIIARSGTITDGYGGLYPNDVQKSITVQGEQCEVEWLEFDVEDSEDCIYDFVDIVDITSGLWWERNCGSGLPKNRVVKFTGDGFSIVLHTDAAVQARGFKLRFECGVWDEARAVQNPTSAPPTAVPPTPVPTTQAPATPAPATEAPATSAPPTAAPATSAPPTQAPATPAPPTQAPATPAPPTQAPATPAPPTQAPATPAPPTQAPATPAPATAAPATPAPATMAPATSAPAPAPMPRTSIPSTSEPATPEPSTLAPAPVPTTRVPTPPWVPITPVPSTVVPEPVPVPCEHMTCRKMNVFMGRTVQGCSFTRPHGVLVTAIEIHARKVGVLCPGAAELTVYIGETCLRMVVGDTPQRVSISEEFASGTEVRIGVKNREAFCVVEAFPKLTYIETDLTPVPAEWIHLRTRFNDGENWALPTRVNGTVTDGYTPTYQCNLNQTLTLTGTDCDYSFPSFALEASDDCQYDHLRVTVGSWSYKFCGNKAPPSFSLNGKQTVVLEFFTDEAVVSKGFTMNFGCAPRRTVPRIEH